MSREHRVFVQSTRTPGTCAEAMIDSGFSRIIRPAMTTGATPWGASSGSSISWREVVTPNAVEHAILLDLAQYGMTKNGQGDA